MMVDYILSSCCCIHALDLGLSVRLCLVVVYPLAVVQVELGAVCSGLDNGLAVVVVVERVDVFVFVRSMSILVAIFGVLGVAEPFS